MRAASEMAANNSSGDSFDTSAFVMSNSVRSRSRSRTASCLARKDSTATANSLATRSRNASSAGLGSRRRRGAEAERAQPVVAGSERDEHRCTDPVVAREPSRPPASESQTRAVEITSRLLVEPYPTGGILIDGQPQARMTGLPGALRICFCIPLLLRIVQTHADVLNPTIRRSDSATPESRLLRSYGRRWNARARQPPRICPWRTPPQPRS